MKKRLFKNNKGIAMVTIMITIMFLSVIATTLLYISASNYTMKVANAYGKANYYETDGILVKTTTAIRQSAQANPHALAGVIVTAPTDTASGTYDIQKIAALVDATATGSATNSSYHTSSVDSLNPASATGDTIVFHTNNNEIVKTVHPTMPGVTRYVFKDIEITQTSARGFENSVKTDLVYDVYEQSTGGSSAGGVGNMSMLLDSPLSSTAANFKNLTMAGNAFVADYGTAQSWEGDTYIAPGPNGLVMSNESRLNLCGTNNVVYGDLKLSGNSTLCVYGNLTVYGDISVTGNATMIVAGGGKVYQYTAGALPGRTNPSTVSGNANNFFPSPLTVDTVDLDEFKTFADTIGIKNPEGTPGSYKYGLINKIFKKGPVDKNGSTPWGANTRFIDINPGVGDITVNSTSPLLGTITMNNNTFDLGRGYKLDNDLYGCKKFGLGFIEYGRDTSSMNASDYNYRLMISFNNTPIILQQSTPFTTWICKSPVSCSQAHCVVLSKVGTTQFNYMTAGKGDSQSVLYDNNTNPFNNVNIKFGSTTFQGKFGALFDQNCNLYVDTMFGASVNGAGSGGTPVYTTAISFENFERDFDL